MRKNTDRYNLPRSELQYLIDQWIFNERHRLLLADRLFNGTTYERLAEKYDLSTQQVKNIVYKAMDRLEKHLYIIPCRKAGFSFFEKVIKFYKKVVDK